MLKFSKNLLPVSIVIAGAIIGGVLLYAGQGCPPEKAEGLLTAQEAGRKAVAFINENLLPEGTKSSLLSAAEESDVYKIWLELEGQEFPSYVTKDGKLLFPDEGINLDEGFPVYEEPVAAVEPTEIDYSEEQLETLAKCLSEKGVKFYGTPGCPYCVQQRAMFGRAAEYLPYVDCVEKRDECGEANVGPVPDWRFPDDAQRLGMLPIKELAELSGCGLAEQLIHF